MNKKEIMSKDMIELIMLLLDGDVSHEDRNKIEKVLSKKISANYSINSNILYEQFRKVKNIDDIQVYLCNNNISLFMKKIILEHCCLDKDLFYLLNKNIPYELKRFIIKYRLCSFNNIVKLIKDNTIEDELKKFSIKSNITEINVINILLDDNINTKSREYILSIKNKQFINRLRMTSNKELIYKLTFEFYESGNCLNNVDFIKKYKPDLLKNISKSIDKKYIKKAFSNTSCNHELINMVFKNCKSKIDKIINDITDEEAIEFLSTKKLPKEYAQIIIKNNINYLNNYIDKFNIDEIIKKLRIGVEFSTEFKNYIISRRCKDLANELSKYDLNEYLKYIKYHYYNDELIVNTINNILFNEDVFCTLGGNYLDDIIVEFILKYKNDYISDFLSNINWDNIIYNKKINDVNFNIITSLPNNIQSKIYKKNYRYIKSVLDSYDKDTLNKFLCNKDIIENKLIFNMQTIILKSFNISRNKINYCRVIIKYCRCENILNSLKSIELFFNKLNIDINLFFQYSGYNFKLLNDIIKIVDNNEINDFINVKNYLFRYYFNNTFNNATIIIYLNLIIENYKLYKNLLRNISNRNIILNNNDKCNLNMLFNNILYGTPDNLYELDELKKRQFDSFKEEILLDNTSISRIKSIFFNNILSFNNMFFDDIGNISSLKILQKDNSNNKEINYLIEEIIISMDIINKIINTDNKDELSKLILSYIDGKDTLINNMINNIIDIKSKIRRLYELDSMYNLTTLDTARKIPNIYNEEYMKIYGGEVFDFSDKNYVLYAHVLSKKENIDNLINGYSDGNSNFISFSPISYRGQRYYYRTNCILAYDRIFDNSFICSSLTNMGSNYMIDKNSAQVSDNNRQQRGILETSSVKENNAETLLYREGLKPCGIILVDGKKPTDNEIMYHKKYNLPFIITQKAETAIDNPKRVFTSSKGKYIDENKIKELDGIKNYISSKLIINKENDIYTGREVAIFTDTHAMYEPTIAILEDIRLRSINEIYSLGDNTSLGPNPREVLDLMDKYNVKQIMGNSEYYLTLGGSPFSYWSEEREKSLDWTNDKVQGYINNLKLYKPSLDILVGDKKIALCHFGNDIRWDFNKHNTWTYQENFGNSASQFLFTNSDEYNKEIEYMINKYGIDNPKICGYLSSRSTPMFEGKTITSYDDVFQGHVHFELEDKINNTNIYTLRGAGMGELEDNKKSMAYYVILKEKKQGGFDLEKVYVPFNKNSLLSSIYYSDMPSKTKILSYLK